ncbi:MAG: maleylpyruvate isomerase family mycothiol-dependent enzyme [Nocardioides sp.]
MPTTERRLETRLPAADYRTHLERESRRFRDVLADADPGAKVPSCPAWSAADLLWHLTEVQHGWAWTVAHRPSGRDDYEGPERPASYADSLALFDRACADLVGALADADPAEEAWTWAGDHTVGFILRRQALESLVHRLDAEQAVGAVTAMDPALAADGVHEVLDVMYGGCPPWGDFSPLPHYLRVDCSDTGTSVWVQIGRFSGTDPQDEVRYEEDDISVVDDPGVEPDAVISGSAEELLARLWRRGDGASIRLAGDMHIVDHFRNAIHHPID